DSRDENLAIPMLLETWIVRASVRLPVVRWASVITLVRPLLLVGIRQVPPSAKTASSFRTRPSVRSAAAVKSLAVEPGSNGSVKADALAEPAAVWTRAQAV